MFGRPDELVLSWVRKLALKWLMRLIEIMQVIHAVQLELLAFLSTLSLAGEAATAFWGFPFMTEACCQTS